MRRYRSPCTVFSRLKFERLSYVAVDECFVDGVVSSVDAKGELGARAYVMREGGERGGHLRSLA